VGLAVSKFEAIAPAVIACEATNRRIALLVGSAIAWKTSLLIKYATFWLQNYMQPFGFTSVFEKIFLNISNAIDFQRTQNERLFIG